MGVLKHSPTLVYTNYRSSRYLLFALAVSLVYPQGVAAAPTSNTSKGQGAQQPGAIEQELYRLFLRLTSSLNMRPGSSVGTHRKRKIPIPPYVSGPFNGSSGRTPIGNPYLDQDHNPNGNGGGSQNTHTTTSKRATTTSPSIPTPAHSETTQGGNDQAPASETTPTPPPPTSTESGATSQSNIGTQVSTTTPSGGNQQPPNPLPPQNNGNTSPPVGSQAGMTTETGSGSSTVVNGDGAGSPNKGLVSSPNKGLVIGLVISLVILALLGCFVAGFFLRRARKRRREREQTSTQDDTARMWEKDGKSTLTGNHGEKQGNTPSPVATLDSRASLTPSATSYVRARTPGGSAAIPMPYNPSEISDDVSAHFAMLPPDHKIGVPVPYPLALHVPSRVQQAMSERDERWQQYELLRQNQSRTDDYSETSTIPRPASRMPQRRSTLRSVTSGMASSEAYTGVDSRRNSHRSAWENEPYFASEVDRSRSEVTANDHHGGQSARSSMMSDLPSPPLPSLQPHRRDGSYAAMIRVRRLPPLPGQQISTDGFPFATPMDSPSSSTNPFNTDPNVNIPGMNNISEEPASLENSEEVTGKTSTRHGGEDWSAPVVGSVTGVARAASARTVHYLGRSSSNGFGPRLPASQNPFNDGPSRFSAADSISETVDTHQIHGMIDTFPAPPDPTRRLL